MLHEEFHLCGGNRASCSGFLVRSSKLPKIPFSGHYTHKYFHKHMPAVLDTSVRVTTQSPLQLHASPEESQHTNFTMVTDCSNQLSISVIHCQPTPTVMVGHISGTDLRDPGGTVVYNTQSTTHLLTYFYEGAAILLFERLTDSRCIPRRFVSWHKEMPCH